MFDLDKLSEQYNFVSNKTNALHMMSEQLLADQTKLSKIGKCFYTPISTEFQLTSHMLHSKQSNRRIGGFYWDKMWNLIFFIFFIFGLIYPFSIF